jgi:SHS2 domain-containing protein
MHRFLEHPGEVDLVVEAPSEEGVFAETAIAFAELLDAGPGSRNGEREVELAAPDLARLLVEWANELIYLAEVDGFVPERVAELHLAPGRLHARVEGRLGAEPAHLVKAATLSNLRFELAGDRWHARLVLDV